MILPGESHAREVAHTLSQQTTSEEKPITEESALPNLHKVDYILLGESSKLHHFHFTKIK